MTEHEATALRDGLDELAAGVPLVGFGAADVIRRGRRRRRTRVALAAGGTALAVAAVVAAVPLLSPGRPATLPAGPSTSASTTTPNPRPTVPGVSPAEAAAIIRRCAPVDSNIEAMRLYNLVRDAAGTHAMLFAPGTQVVCEIRPGRDDALSSGASQAPAFPYWMPGPVTIDSGWGAVGDDGADTPVTSIDGRVGAEVAYVTVRLGNHTVHVTPLNRTYVARFVGVVPPENWLTTRAYATAYDAAGRVLGHSDGRKSTCYASPDGTVVIFSENPAQDHNCRAAIRWP